MTDRLPNNELQQKMAKALAFYRRNPMTTMKEVQAACGVSAKTAWLARQRMVIEGVCKPNRRAGKSLAAPEPDSAPSVALPAAPAPNTLLDGEQLAALAAGVTDGVDDADPETRKKMLRELRGIAFGLTNHPDTRVTAMKAWFTLKDMASAKDLGPGIPKTFDAAVLRLKDLNTATGFKVAFAAFMAAFTLMDILHAIEQMMTRKEPTDAQPQSQAVEPSAPSSPTSVAPDAPINNADVRNDQGADGSTS